MTGFFVTCDINVRMNMNISEKPDKSSNKVPKNQAATYSAPALEKGLDILELLAETEGGLSQKDLSSRIGRSVSEIYRMLNVLVQRGYVVSESDSYTLSTKLFQLSHYYPPTARLVTEATPLMHELSREIEFSCHLSVYNMGKQTVIASAEVPHGMGFHFRVGTEIGIPLSASGQVLVAFHDPITRGLRIKECFEGSKIEEDRFRKSLDDVLRKGFSSIQSRQFSGLHAVSFPVLDINHKAIAALTVPMLKRLDVKQTSLKEVEKKLGKCAELLNHRIS